MGASRDDGDKAGRTALTFGYWVCDECRLTYGPVAVQHEVGVQQRTERIYGSGTVYRPVEALVVCGNCMAKYERTTGSKP